MSVSNSINHKPSFKVQIKVSVVRIGFAPAHDEVQKRTRGRLGGALQPAVGHVPPEREHGAEVARAHDAQAALAWTYEEGACPMCHGS